MSAIHEAFVEEVGRKVFETERNCEDAVNVIAYEAYCARNGSTPFHLLDVAEMDEFLGAARKFVKRNGKYYGVEWEEF